MYKDYTRLVRFMKFSLIVHIKAYSHPLSDFILVIQMHKILKAMFKRWPQNQMLNDFVWFFSIRRFVEVITSVRPGFMKIRQLH